MDMRENLKSIFNILNIFYALCGIVFSAVGIKFLVDISELVELRNINHYLWDYRIYWPQLAPWLFIFIGMFIMIVAFCGYCGANRESRGLLGIYGLCLIIIILLQFIAATLIFVFVDGEDTDRFIKDTVYDGYYNSQSNPDVFKAFGRIERKLKCCGANDARDYRSWRNDLPLTCCLDSYYRATCESTDKEANQRLGCAKAAVVAVRKTTINLLALSVFMLIVAFPGIIMGWQLRRYTQVYS